MSVPPELYHRLLGIPVKDQPPTLYRLLGVEAFEENRDVIDAAAERQMTFLKNHQLGPNAAHVEHLLGQVAQARVTLLNPERRAAYDQTLRAAKSTPAAAPVRPTRPKPIAAAEPEEGLSDLFAHVGEQPGGSSTAGGARPTSTARSSKSFPLPWVIGGGVAVVLLILVVVFSTQSTPNRPVVEHTPPTEGFTPPETNPTETGSTETDAPQTDSNGSNPTRRNSFQQGRAAPVAELELLWPEPQRADAQVLLNGRPAPSGRATAASITFEVPPGPNTLRIEWAGLPARTESFEGIAGRTVSLRIEQPISAAPASPDETEPSIGSQPTPEPAIASNGTPTGPASPTERLEVPATEEIEQAIALLDEEHGLGDDLDDATKRLAVDHLIASAVGETSSPVERYAALYRAALLAGEAASADRLSEALTALEASFVVDRLALEHDVLVGIAEYWKSQRASEQIVSGLLKMAVPFSDRALAAHRPDLADEALTAFQPLALPYRGHRLALHHRRTRLKPSLDHWQERQDAEARLIEDPEDGQAHETLGRWLCLEVGDWEAGLPHLAKATDDGLRQAALAELEKPTDTEAQLALAELWWQASESATDQSAKRLRQRAGRWYQRALPQLTAIVDRLRVQKRLNEIGELPPEPVASRSVEPQRPTSPRNEELKAGDVLTNSIGMKLAYIPPGTFLMGSPESEEGRQNDETQHRVTLSRGYYLGVYEVTQGEYEHVMGKNPSEFKVVAGQDTRRFPVERVTWEDAQEFCRKLSALPEERAAGRVYRLPTEAEWEYACRAGSTTPFHFGDVLNGREANMNGNLPYGTSITGPNLERPTTVGSYPANAWGLYDMHGNVWEWCSDWYRQDYERLAATDPRNDTKSRDRVLRGGSWDVQSQRCRSACRHFGELRRLYNTRGFRVALSLPEPAAPPVPVPQPPAEPAVESGRKAGDVLTNSIGMKLAWCPPGTFMMGSPESEEGRQDDETQHRVTLSRGYYLGVHPVTVGEFRRFVVARSYRTEAERDGEGGRGYNTGAIKLEGGPKYTWENTGWPQTESHPVVNVTWNDAVAYCAWLSETEGRDYRLPSEAEWEYACRAGTTTRYFTGDAEETLEGYANVRDQSLKRMPVAAGWTSFTSFDDGHAFTSPVGSYRANAWGLHDMHGNVWQWCQDWYHADYERLPATDPRNDTVATHRVLRSGGFFSYVRRCRSANRHHESPSHCGSSVGFRVALSQ